MLRIDVSPRNLSTFGSTDDLSVIGMFLSCFICLSAAVSFATENQAPAPSDPAKVPVFAASPLANELFTEASAEFNRKRYDLAASKYQLFLNRHSDDPLADYARHYIGVCSLNRGDLDDASSMFAKVVRSKAQPGIREEALFNFGWCLYQRSGKERTDLLNQAATVFRRFRHEYPQSKRVIDALFLEADIMAEREELEAARDVYKIVVQEHLQSARRPDALFFLALIERKLKNTVGANACFDELIRVYPHDRRTTAIYFEVAERHFAAENYEKAEELYGRVVADGKHDEADVALVRQATSLAKLNENARAAELYERLPQQYPDSKYTTEAWLAAGHHYVWAKKYDRAEACLAHIIKNDLAESDKAGHWLVRCYLETKKWNRALETAEAALQRGPEGIVRHNLLLDRADALAAITGRHSDAFVAYAETCAEAQLPFLVIRSLEGMLELGRTDKQFAYLVKTAARVLQQSKEKEVVIGAKLAMATAETNLGNTAASCRLYRELLSEFDEHESTIDWFTSAGWAAVLSDDFEMALQLVSEHRRLADSPALKAEIELIAGFALTELERFEEAIPALEQVIRLVPNSPNAADAMEPLTRCYRLTGRNDQAQKSLRQLLKQDPVRRNSDSIKLELAELAYLRGDSSAAEDYYSSVVQADLTPAMKAKGLHRLAWISLRNKQYDKAAITLTRLIEEYPQDELVERAYLDRARCYQLLGEHAHAISDLWEFLESKPESEELQARAVFALGISFIHEDRVEDAKAAFATICDSYSSNERADEALFQLGALSHKLELAIESIDAFQKLIQRHPRSEFAPTAKFHLAQLLYDRHENDVAVNLFAAAIEAGEGQSFMQEIHYRLGWACYRDKQFRRAAAAFARQQEQFPSDEFAHDSLFMQAESQYRRDDWGKALSLYDALLEHAETSGKMLVVTILHRGQSALELGRYAEAADSLERILRDHADSPYRANAELSLGICRAREEKFVAAEHHLEQGCRSENLKVASQSRYELAQVYARQAQYDRAIGECVTLMHVRSEGEANSKRDRSVEKLQAMAGQSAAELATLMASDTASEIERDACLEKAASYWGYVLEEHPMSAAATVARAQLESLVAHGAEDSLNR